MNPAACVFVLALSLAPAAEAAAPSILTPAPGATVSSPVTITIAPGSATGSGAMAMPGMANMPGMAHGHLHLIIDAPLPQAGSSIPMDKHHLHLMHGETSKTLSLPPGQHTIQLIAGSAGHKVLPDAAHSDPVTFTVK